MLLRVFNLCLLALSLCLYSCKKNDAPSVPDVKPGEENVAKITTRIQGIVNPRSPLSGAVVSCGGKTTTTNNKGVFYFEDVEVNAKAALITVSANGYSRGVRTFTVSNKDALQYTEITLLNIYPEFNKTFDATKGASLQMSYGPRVVFEPNQMLKNDNTPYSGTVTVNYFEGSFEDNNRLSYLYDNTFGSVLLGSNTGVNKAGKDVGILNKRIVGLSMKGSSGEVLHIDTTSGRGVDIFLSMQYISPEKGNPTLWYVNESGIWQEEGNFSITGDTFVIKTQHPGSISLSTSYEAIELKGKLIDTISGRTWNNNVVCIMTKDEQTVVYATTNSQGEFAVKVPANTTVSILMLGTQSKYADVMTNNIELTTGTENMNPGIIHVPANDTYHYFSVNGEVTGCDRELINDGTIVMTTRDSLKHEFPIKNGWYHAFFTGTNISDRAELITLAIKGKTPAYQFAYDYNINRRDLNTCGLIIGGYYRYTFRNIQYIFHQDTDTIGLYKTHAGPYGLYISSYGTGGNYVFWDFPETFPTVKGNYKAPVLYYAPSYSTYYYEGTMDYTITKAAPIGGYIEATFKGLLKNGNPDKPNDTITMQGDLRILLQ
jgi:hypothetical protein